MGFKITMWGFFSAQAHNVFYNFNEAVRMPNLMKAHLTRECSSDERTFNWSMVFLLLRYISSLLRQLQMLMEKEGQGLQQVAGLKCFFQVASSFATARAECRARWTTAQTNRSVCSSESPVLTGGS